MKKEELQRLDEGRNLMNEIVVAETYLEVVSNKDYTLVAPKMYSCGLTTDFPFFGDEFARDYREFLKKWTEDYLKVLKNKFEAL